MSKHDVSIINQIIAEKLALDLKKVSDNLHIINDLGADSLDVFEIMMSLEEYYDIEISDDDAIKCNTVEDVKNGINNILNGKSVDSIGDQQIFNITVCRTSYASKDIQVVARDINEAKEKAITIAYNYSFKESSANYSVE